MARVLESHNWKTRAAGGTKVAIDDEWFDGQPHLLVMGEDYEGTTKNARSTVQGRYTSLGEPEAKPGYEGVVTVLNTETVKDVTIDGEHIAEGFVVQAIRLDADGDEGRAMLARRAGMRTASTTHAVEDPADGDESSDDEGDDTDDD